jgi:hypothetical protein
MAEADDPLRQHDTGPYEVLAARPNPDGLVVLTVPPFEVMLPLLERKLGRPLTADEAAAKRRSAPSIALTPEQARGMASALPGYPTVSEPPAG